MEHFIIYFLVITAGAAGYVSERAHQERIVLNRNKSLFFRSMKYVMIALCAVFFWLMTTDFILRTLIALRG